MPRNIRIAPGGMVFHVMNRGVANLRIFRKDEEYIDFEEILEETLEDHAMRICAYCLLPDHWRLVLWPRRKDDLGAFVQKVTVAHTRRWQKSRKLVGTGHLYQGRYKSFPVQQDDHYWQVVRDVEAAARRAKSTNRAEQWRWSSLWRRYKGTDEQQALITDGPIELPNDWKRVVNRASPPDEADLLEISIARGQPYGDMAWMKRTAKRLQLESTLRPRGRPRKE